MVKISDSNTALPSERTPHYATVLSFLVSPRVLGGTEKKVAHRNCGHSNLAPERLAKTLSLQANMFPLPKMMTVCGTYNHVTIVLQVEVS